MAGTLIIIDLSDQEGVQSKSTSKLCTLGNVATAK
jgi:hypothetical protein